jgi:hypothetical protein
MVRSLLDSGVIQYISIVIGMITTEINFMYQNLICFRFVSVLLLMIAITSCNKNKPAVPQAIKPSVNTTPFVAAPSPTPTITVSTPTPTLKATSPSAVLALPSPSLGLSPSSTPSIVPSATSTLAEPYQVVDELKKNQYVVSSQKVLSPGNLPAAPISFDAQKLLTVLNNTKSYFTQNIDRDPTLARNGILANQGVTVANTIDTLSFMTKVLKEDIKAKRPLRLQNSAFIQKNFRVIKWNAANPQEPDRKQVRMTKYAVFTHAGSLTKTPLYDTALYQLKNNQLDTDHRQYTKQQVLDGIYEAGGTQKGGAEPLVYLTRAALEDALMEGTTIIKLADGSQRMFNVDRSNEIPYVKGLDKRQQKRYWYFKPVQNIKGYGYQMAAKISIEPGVTFAGDVLNIGLGKIVVVEDLQGKNKQLRLGVIADTGGAFMPNLHQLDFLAGVFENQEKFQQYSKQLPEYTNVYFLVKK